MTLDQASPTALVEASIHTARGVSATSVPGILSGGCQLIPTLKPAESLKFAKLEQKYQTRVFLIESISFRKTHLRKLKGEN